MLYNFLLFFPIVGGARREQVMKLVIPLLNKKSLKIPKGQSESAN